MKNSLRTTISVVIYALVFSSGATFSNAVLASGGGSASALSADTMSKLNKQLNSGHEKIPQEKLTDTITK